MTAMTAMPMLWITSEGTKSKKASVEPSTGLWTEYMNADSSPTRAVTKTRAKTLEVARDWARWVRS